jgi:hypothetical protein
MLLAETDVNGRPFPHRQTHDRIEGGNQDGEKKERRGMPVKITSKTIAARRPAALDAPIRKGCPLVHDQQISVSPQTLMRSKARWRIDVAPGRGVGVELVHAICSSEKLTCGLIRG